MRERTYGEQSRNERKYVGKPGRIRIQEKK